MSKQWAPIVLSEYGEAFDHYPVDPMARGIPRDFDEDKLSTCCGVHRLCRGFIDIHRVSLKYNALHCRQCGWRVLIPKELETVGDLRKWATKLFEQAESK